jgi:hypothetical protein
MTARHPARLRFTPEPVTTAVPPSQRGWIEAAPEPGRAGQYRLWLHGDGATDRPRSLLVTAADIRRLCAFLHRLLPDARPS